MGNKIHIIIDFMKVNDCYFNKKMNCLEISSLLGINSNTLYYRMKKEGIKLRNGSERQKGELNHQYGKSISKNVRNKLSKLFIGENNPFYNKKHKLESIQKMKDNLPDRHGANNLFFNKRHKLNTKIQISISNGGTGIFKINNYPIEFNQKLRNCILELYGNICKSCLISNKKHLEKYGRNLECHHIDYNKENNNIFNFVPLCKKCNIKVNKDKDFWKKYFENIVFELRFSLIEQIKENRLKNFKEYEILKTYFNYLDKGE